MAATLLTIPSSASAHHGGAHMLKLYSLTCWAQNDSSGADEPYLKIDSNRFWSGPDCLPVTTIDLGGLEQWFWNQAELRIMEDDFGRDDTVGFLLVGPQAWTGVQTYTSYKLCGCVSVYIINYQLVYEIL
jgi:hypothetical protein